MAPPAFDIILIKSKLTSFLFKSATWITDFTAKSAKRSLQLLITLEFNAVTAH